MISEKCLAKNNKCLKKNSVKISNDPYPIPVKMVLSNQSDDSHTSSARTDFHPASGHCGKVFIMVCSTLLRYIYRRVI